MAALGGDDALCHYGNMVEAVVDNDTAGNHSNAAALSIVLRHSRPIKNIIEMLADDAIQKSGKWQTLNKDPDGKDTGHQR